MHIIAQGIVREYSKQHPEAANALWSWYKKTEKAQWKNFADIRRDFATVSQVGGQHYVFNIKGNDHRLVVVIKFTIGRVFIRFIGTHEEYDRIKDIEKL
ncbi:MAG: type II toxin-antitoxin system HigB family toxin [Bacteroidales bacterium]|nr:type II toxin-antitoxin system HigB family toxin [Bacteroidales bacterium]